MNPTTVKIGAVLLLAWLLTRKAEAAPAPKTTPAPDPRPAPPPKAPDRAPVAPTTPRAPYVAPTLGARWTYQAPSGRIVTRTYETFRGVYDAVSKGLVAIVRLSTADSASIAANEGEGLVVGIPSNAADPLLGGIRFKESLGCEGELKNPTGYGLGECPRLFPLSLEQTVARGDVRVPGLNTRA